MIDPSFVAHMARYNAWQNQNLNGAADTLSDAARRAQSGAFFGSIHGTLSHLLWADRIWMSRFADWPKPDGGIPESPALYPDWEALKHERADSDAGLIAWADALAPDWLDGELTWYSGAAKAMRTRPRAELVMHLFNHQTHHRGQVHCMLTQAGAKPSDTDLMMLKR